MDGSVRLRPWTAADVDALYDAVMTDQEHLARWLSFARGEYTLERADAYVANCLAGYRTTAGLLEFAIEIDGVPIGSIGVPRSAIEHREYEIGYWISGPYGGRGIVTRCAEVLTEYLFTTVGAHRVQIAAPAGNAASRAVAEGLGFTPEGVFRKARMHGGEWHDLAWYAVTEDEWLQMGASDGANPPG